MTELFTPTPDCQANDADPHLTEFAHARTVEPKDFDEFLRLGRASVELPVLGHFHCRQLS